MTFAARVLMKSPGFTVVAVLSLALGIGVNSAVLAVARAVLLQPLPVPEPDRLVVALWSADGVKGVRQLNSGGARHPRTGRNLSTNYSYPAYLALRDRLKDSADVFGFTFMRQANVTIEGTPVVAGGMLVSGSYFGVLGVPLSAGRGLDDRDDRAGAEPAAVISHALWRRAFGEDPGAIGRIIRINGQAFTVVGITARGFFGVSNGGFFPPADVTVPLSVQPLVYPRWTPPGGSLFSSGAVLWLRVMARLKPGMDPGRLERAATAAFREHVTAEAVPAFIEARQIEIACLPGARGLDSMRASLEKPIYMLAGVAVLVFLIACVNLASLVLARGLARQQEFWIRLALGAGRRQLIRQAFAESALLTVAGGALGIVLAVWTGRILVSTLVGSTPTALEVTLDPALVAICAAVSCAAALLFGLLPALRLSSSATADFMRQVGAGASAPRLRAGRVLVLVQIAVSVPLLVGALLFLRTLHNLAKVELGFEPRGLMVFRMDPALNGYDEGRVKLFFERVLGRLQQVPGIQSATLVENAMVSGWVSNTRVSFDGGEAKSILINRVGPGFFETLGLPLVAGRGFGLQDREGTLPAGVLNEAAVRRFFGGSSPIGRRVRIPGTRTVDIEIVGVVRDSKYSTLKEENPPVLFLPYLQSRGMNAMFVLVRTAGGSSMAEPIRAAAAAVDHDVPVTELKTQTQQVDETIGTERAFATVLVFFGGFALLLAAIGLHGVTAYATARRTSEIGIRMALGAQRRDVVWLILRQVVVLAAGGLLVGLPAAVVLSRSASAMLYGIAPGDPASLIAGGAALFVTALIAGFIPARRASQLDPLIALRSE